MKRIVPFVAILLLSLTALAESLSTIHGLAIAVPEGNWKHGVGTCTGDRTWDRQGISFSIGFRAYVDMNDPFEYAPLGYHSFDEITKEEASRIQAYSGRLRFSETKTGKSGDSILVLDFENVLFFQGMPASRNLYAFRETADHRGVAEVSCMFLPEQQELGIHIFQAALESLSRESTPIKDMVPYLKILDGPYAVKLNVIPKTAAPGQSVKVQVEYENTGKASLRLPGIERIILDYMFPGRCIEGEVSAPPLNEKYDILNPRQKKVYEKAFVAPDISPKMKESVRICLSGRYENHTTLEVQRSPTSSPSHP